MAMIRMLDLFAGCGGLTDGFLSSGKYQEVAAVEWLKPQVNTLRNRLKTKWQNSEADQTVLHFDIQREFDLYDGWHDPWYGTSNGLDYYIRRANGIDIIIGGPPCQAYSIAGRVRDENGMHYDYRNYLFEHYVSIVSRYKPKLFVFENVPGILTAKPQGKKITDTIKGEFNKIGYEIIENLSHAKIDISEYGIPQKRERVIILGLNKRVFNNYQELLKNFYFDILPLYKHKYKKSVRETIGNLPQCLPLYGDVHQKGHVSHETPQCSVSWHIPRYHNFRDMETFRILAEDLESGRNEYDSKKISELYKEKVGSESPIHRYHVLHPDKPSTTIIAHLYKDGNRFIHYDSKQCRSITVREAARLQTFDDDFEFIGSMGHAYQMIGNAVPPLFARTLANAIYQVLGDL